MTHTATPFTFDIDNDGGFICGAKGYHGVPNESRVVCNITGDIDDDLEAEANAQFIVIACNSHDELLAAAKAVVDYRKRAGALGFQLEKLDDYLRDLTTAIARAEGREG